MGGAALLARVRAIGWTGTARMASGGHVLDLGIETRIEPFVRARSESWLIDDGRAEKRTIMVEGHDAFVVFRGRQVSLPPAQATHEREEFGVYGHLLLAGTAFARGGAVLSSRPGYPDALLALGRDGMPTSAAYVVASPDSPGRIREHFIFSGSVSDNGLRWPRRIAVTRDGKPFVVQTIEDLTVELSAA